MQPHQLKVTITLVSVKPSDQRPARNRLAGVSTPGVFLEPSWRAWRVGATLGPLRTPSASAAFSQTLADQVNERLTGGTKWWTNWATFEPGWLVERKRDPETSRFGVFLIPITVW